MSRGADHGNVVGINWGSARLRAYLIDGDGIILDEVTSGVGVAGLDRAGMAETIGELRRRWPDAAAVYLAGMICSGIGWGDVPHAPAPAGAAALDRSAARTLIGDVEVMALGGLACRRALDTAPDIMRGEEVELMGLLADRPDWTGVAVVPGAHAKWVLVNRGSITEFVTSMGGEIYDRLTATGLLASVVEGEPSEGPAFLHGVGDGRDGRLGLGAALFGVRARVVRGDVPKSDAASYLRGLLIGAEIADAMTLWPTMLAGGVPLVGEAALCRLYSAALAKSGIRSPSFDPRRACARGFAAIHAARTPVTKIPASGPDLSAGV